MSKELSIVQIERANAKVKAQKNALSHALFGHKYRDLSLAQMCAWIDSAFATSTNTPDQIRGFVYACDYYLNGKESGDCTVIKAAACITRNNSTSFGTVRKILEGAGFEINRNTGNIQDLSGIAAMMLPAVIDSFVNAGFTSWQGGFTPAKAGSERYGITLEERNEQYSRLLLIKK